MSSAENFTQSDMHYILDLVNLKAPLKTVADDIIFLRLGISFQLFAQQTILVIFQVLFSQKLKKKIRILSAAIVIEVLENSSFCSNYIFSFFHFFFLPAPLSGLIQQMMNWW